MRNHDRRTYLTDDMLPPNLKYAKSTLQSSQQPQIVNHNNPTANLQRQNSVNPAQAKAMASAAAAAAATTTAGAPNIGPTDWNAQVQQFQRFLQWQQYQE